jgi:hypothetical protein
VPLHQDRKGVLVLLNLEALEQHSVAEAAEALRPLSDADPADVSQDRSQSFSDHALHPFSSVFLVPLR